MESNQQHSTLSDQRTTQDDKNCAIDNKKTKNAATAGRLTVNTAEI